ncbi:hypothetical protein ACFYRC_34230 [Streptomyces sp. NPDC005279]|uniref:hypothetical protein n=1 Tax=Streptomyces sp. NPDC005279 TaxID=3364712 RepID=UPI0036895C7B
MIYLGHPTDALGLLGVAAKNATKALVASQTGQVHAALGDEQQAERHLGEADELLTDGLGDDVPEWVAYFDAAEHAGARAVSARDLTGLGRNRRAASIHFEDALALRKPGEGGADPGELVGDQLGPFVVGAAARCGASVPVIIRVRRPNTWAICFSSYSIQSAGSSENM